MNEQTLRTRIVHVARRLDQKGILTATDGNISVRLPNGGLLITPSGTSKGELKESDLVVVHPDGRFEGGRPSSELALHRTIYAWRTDVQAVVHAHPPHATAYAVAGMPLEDPILSEAVLNLGKVPVAPYAMPTAEELARSVEPYLMHHEAVLLRFHGAVCYSSNIERAGYLMETLEHVARIDYLRRTLGSSAVIPEAEVEQLNELRRRLAGTAGASSPRDEESQKDWSI